MEIANLASFAADSSFEADVAIVGGGPAGLTIAREFFGTSTRVLILESGLLDETPDHAALNEVESVGEPRTDAQKRKRIAFHGAQSLTWSHDVQPYGVRCRGLGGSTQAWAGKSAAFDEIDFAMRPWVPHSGWPITRASLDPYLDRAADALNLGPNCYDDGLWKLMGVKPPELRFDGLRSFFWQFARSRIDHLDVIRVGREFLTSRADNVRVLLNATATQIGLTPDGGSFEGIEVSTIDGARSKVKARMAVIAASSIENARLLLASNAVQSNGIGNGRDLVGRFLMDHAGARVARFDPGDAARVMRRFGFYGLRHQGRTHMYMHGLAPTPALQERLRLLNSAVYFMPEHSPDDPWGAFKRLLRRSSAKPMEDARIVMGGAGLVAKGIGMKVLASGATPDLLKEFIVNTAIRVNPNLVADEFRSRGMPHKLSLVSIDAIAEQRPDPDSRVRLSDRTDRFGMPLAKVDWRINNDERRTIVQLARLTRDVFASAGLPTPILESWVDEERLGDADIIDMAHSAGTTRMSASPASGVVDQDCQVHGVRGLFISGGSVFPTIGHANPTLMILALAIRLSDKIKSELGR
jgi:choline dehydrogenase-like flavoprotein